MEAISEFNKFKEDDNNNEIEKYILYIDFIANVLLQPHNNFHINLSNFATSTYTKFNTKYGSKEYYYFDQLESYIGLINEIITKFLPDNFKKSNYIDFINNINELYNLSEIPNITYTHVSQSPEFIKLMYYMNFPVDLIFDNIYHNFTSKEEALLDIILNEFRDITESMIFEQSTPTFVYTYTFYSFRYNFISGIEKILKDNMNIIEDFNYNNFSDKYNKIKSKTLIAPVYTDCMYTSVYIIAMIQQKIKFLYEPTFIAIMPDNLIKILCDKYLYLLPDTLINDKLTQFIIEIKIPIIEFYNKIKLANLLIPANLNKVINSLNLNEISEQKQHILRYISLKKK